MTDIKLDQEGGHWVVVDAGALKVAGTDLMLDSPERRGSNRRGHRRALVHDFNDGLTINYNRDYTGGVKIESALKVAGTDLMLDSPERRGSNRGGHRRALVHDFNDGLTINYNRDYTGGVTIENARVRLRVNSGPKLPEKGRVGELYLMQTTLKFEGQHMGVSTSLWLCLGTPTPLADALGAAVTWQEIPLGQTKRGG